MKKYKDIYKGDVTLSVTDKAFAVADAQYKVVVGRKNCCSLDSMMDAAVDELRQYMTFKGCKYRVICFSDCYGYAKSCSWRKEVIRVEMIVSADGAKSFRLESFDCERECLYPGEKAINSVKTEGHYTTLKHLEDFGFSLRGGFNSFDLNEDFRDGVMSRLEGHLAPLTLTIRRA